MKIFSIFLLLFSIPLSAQDNPDKDKEITAIKKVIQEAYADGILNKGDIDTIEKGFHPGFAILGMSNNSLWKYPIYNWIESVSKKKREGKFPPEKMVTFKYPLIDISGTAAVVRVEFFEGEYHKYTDFLSLYKFDEGWRIVSKIFFEHSENKQKEQSVL